MHLQGQEKLSVSSSSLHKGGVGGGLLTQMMEQGGAGGNSIPLGGEESFS